MAARYSEDMAFYEQLRHYYLDNRGKIRRNYKDLTRKFLDHNDSSLNPAAYLRRPQFEALEMYVFIKEFMDNAQVYTMFDDWRSRRGSFADASYYSRSGHGQLSSYDDVTEIQTDILFRQMKKYSEPYPNYIYALTMGLGKTILMATCIFYEFLLAGKYPKDPRFCHNVLVFAPDKTVLQSLREIVTFDKTLVVPPEYARVLDANIKIHFLDAGGTTLNTLDDSDFNIIISNTQKIIVKKKHKAIPPTGQLFKMASDIDSESDLTFNQRFMKLCRLSQIGVFVDEAHHLFGSDLEKSLRTNSAQTSLRNTINLLAEDLMRNGTSVVACYNYTGTPYVKNQLLPEVVYAYGLKESIYNGYLKDADVRGFDNVKSVEFLRAAVTQFWERYGEGTYEGLLPKLAIFCSRIEEVELEVRPALEQILQELGVPLSKILVNVGDSSITKSDDIRSFNQLDVAGSEGSRKQFLLLVEKGREGWNCRSLFGVALYRSPTSKIFVLQATMRCLRKITDTLQTATVFLSKDNFDTLNDELNKNFNMEIKDLGSGKQDNKRMYDVRVNSPPRYLDLKSIRHEYSLVERELTAPVDFGFAALDVSQHAATVYEKEGIARDLSVKESSADAYRESVRYSAYTLTGEIARYLNISCMRIARLLTESVDGIDRIVEMVSRYNALLDELLIPHIFHALYELRVSVKSENKRLVLLKVPKDGDCYRFSAKPENVLTDDDPSLKKYRAKSFHADTYCFDSKPEMECFLQYLASDRVKQIYFTGMFTRNQGDLSIQYYDPESHRIRHYYPDFIARMADGTYEIIEVKGDNKIDDAVVRAKAEAVREIAVGSAMTYRMYAGSFIMNNNILEEPNPIEVHLGLNQ